jgi:beta-N-acetylhexosaminidase
MKYRIPQFLLILLILLFSGVRAENPSDTGDPGFLLFMQDHWVDDMMSKLTLDQKIAQLMMPAFFPSQGEVARDKMISIIEEYQPGGIIVMKGNPSVTTDYINQFQERSTVPVITAIDGEWGLAMRIDSISPYPYAQAIGAISDSAYIYRMGRDIGNQMKQMGLIVNFAPVADINTNPQNPVINFRSFGEDKINVAKKASYLARGMQDAGVVPVAKHFPGHGDTSADSHLELPVISHSRERIDIMESFPFRYLNELGIIGIMSAHLNVPALDPSGKPASVSEKIINGYLRDEIGFKGIVFTDAINMKGVQTGIKSIEVECLKAGNDIVVFVPDMQKAISAVKQAITEGELSAGVIENKCRRVLALKRWAGLHNYRPAVKKDLVLKLNSPQFEITNRKLIKSSLTVLVNQNVLPVQDLANLKIASVMIGSGVNSPFQKMLGNYKNIDHYTLSKNASEKDLAILRTKLDNYNLVIAGVEGINIYPSGKYGTTEIQRNAVADLIRDNKCVVVFFGNAYALKHFENVHHAGGLILAYQNNRLTQELAAQLVFGAFDATGRLPVTIDERFGINHSINVKKNGSLSFSIPEEAGIDSEKLASKIDSLANLGIVNEAYPGCQVLIAKDGNVIFHKCYGFHTYRNEQKVVPGNIYDWASLTKVTGPLPAIMKLVDERKIDIDAPLSRYWPDFKGTDRGGIRVRDFLTHQARMPSWIPFWTMALDEEGKLRGDIFSTQPSAKFNVRVSEKLYLNNNFRQAIYDTIRNIKLLPRKKYVYSDLCFHLFPDIISRLSGIPYEKFLKDNIYSPLGANSVTYNPYLHYPLPRIVPTEIDEFFRNEKLRGFVHDEGAAMLGGVSGNAGLFGTTLDLAKIFQMYLQKGFYGGKRFINAETIEEFTRVQFPNTFNRRALGFDKPLKNNHENSLKDAFPAVSAGKSSFGHTGYTGTFAWADPDCNLLFIFMSNRVYPTRDNLKLSSLNIRTAMHQAVYDCIEK